MKLQASLSGRLLAVVMVGAALSAHGASTKTKSAPAATSPSVATNAAPAAAVIPQSVFVHPTNQKEGKDPFFPRSTRPYASAVVAIPTNPPPSISDLKISGTSGSDERPFVIINNVTFGVGDTNEVISGTSRITVHCLEINRVAGTQGSPGGSEVTATVEVIGERGRRVLRFQPPVN
jgi:hypothetical protein